MWSFLKRKTQFEKFQKKLSGNGERYHLVTDSEEKILLFRGEAIGRVTTEGSLLLEYIPEKTPPEILDMVYDIGGSTIPAAG